MIGRFACSATLAAAASSLFVSPANAELLLTIDRISDTHASMTASGMLEQPPGVSIINGHVLVLDNPYSLAPAEWENGSILLSSTLKAGSTAFEFAYTAGGGHSPHFSGNNSADIHFGTYGGGLPAGKEFTGALEVGLRDGLSFAAPGATGDIYWGAYGSLVKVGMWQIGSAASAPEPASAALLLAGIASLVATRRRKHG